MYSDFERYTLDIRLLISAFIIIYIIIIIMYDLSQKFQSQWKETRTWDKLWHLEDLHLLKVWQNIQTCWATTWLH